MGLGGEDRIASALLDPPRVGFTHSARRLGPGPQAGGPHDRLPSKSRRNGLRHESLGVEPLDAGRLPDERGD